jgi:N-acetylneuraminate synthase
MSKTVKYEKPYLIAEIGINHNGSLNTAKKMIDIAKSSGFDAVKFQKRDPDICVPEDQKKIIRDTPWGKMTYLAYKKKIEFNLKCKEVEA